MMIFKSGFQTAPSRTPLASFSEAKAIDHASLPLSKNDLIGDYCNLMEGRSLLLPGRHFRQVLAAVEETSSGAGRGNSFFSRLTQRERLAYYIGQADWRRFDDAEINRIIGEVRTAKGDLQGHWEVTQFGRLGRAVDLSVGNRFKILIAQIESAYAAPADQIKAMGTLGQNLALADDQFQFLVDRISDPRRSPFGFEQAKPYEQARAYSLLAQNPAMSRKRGLKLAAKIEELSLDPEGRPLEPELTPVAGHLPRINKPLVVNPLAEEQVRAYGHLGQHPIWAREDVYRLIGKIEAADVSEGHQVHAFGFIARNPVLTLFQFLALLDKVMALEGYPSFQAEAIAALAPSYHLTRERVWKLIEHVERAGTDQDHRRHMSPHAQAAAWGALGANPNLDAEEDHRWLFAKISALEIPLLYNKAMALGALSRNPHLSGALYRKVMKAVLSINVEAFIDSLGDHHPEAIAYRREIFERYRK